jgi:hypothetical protein
MDPNDLIKAAPAIAKVAGPLAAAIPLTPIIKAILGDAAAELGQRFGDRVRLYRYGRSLDMLKKAEKMAQDAGFTPKAVPIKLLFPLLEGASFEEDEDLHTMWAALLANAASPENAEKVRPGFIAILKQMAPDEARLLNEIYDEELVRPENDEHGSTDLGSMIFTREYLDEILRNLQWKETIFELCLERLQSEHLISVDYTGDEKELYSLTFSALSLLSLCRPPKPKS